jgi:hypothetical protein
LTEALVVRIRDKAATKYGRRFANYVKAVLSILFAWGAERDYVRTSPAEKVKNIRLQKGTPEANRPWSDEECHAVLNAAPAHMRPAVALNDVYRSRTEGRAAAAKDFLQAG